MIAKNPFFASLAAFAFGIPSLPADNVLIDQTFDGLANDIGGLTFQKIDNGAGGAGSVDFSTGLITTTGVAANTPNSNVGINTSSPIDVGALAPTANGFKITFEVSATDVAVSDLYYNGLFFGVTSGSDANGTAGPSLWANNPHGFGYVAGSGDGGSIEFGYGEDNFVRQDAEGGAANDGNSVNKVLGGTAPDDASFQDGFTITLSLFDDDTWTLTSTGLSTDLNGSGSLTTTGTGMFDYAAISSDLRPYVSLQGEYQGTIEVDRITVTALETTVPGTLEIVSISKANDVVTVQFKGTDGETYDLNKSTTLDFSTLDSQDSITLSGTDTGELQDTGATEDAAFYRVEQQ
ncbi:hypothetical protein [Haloferula sp. A504]|uniref:hypothetical protein n=1 Tax=Haloferula sp. A504 TaxID=3373601 RepID=UPI0031BC1D03|nr:hypothetical protein [Verrucomicrobiaceae bacterium E54]